MENSDVLDAHFLDQEIRLVHASKTKRLINFILDRIIFTFTLGLLFGALFSFIVLDLDSNLLALLDIFSGLIGYVLYFVLTEGLLKGKSPAKYLTNTRVVSYDKDSIYPSMKTIWLRSLSRIVPFEPFSFLGDTGMGWHDRWTDTLVIDERESVY